MKRPAGAEGGSEPARRLTGCATAPPCTPPESSPEDYRPTVSEPHLYSTHQETRSPGLTPGRAEAGSTGPPVLHFPCCDSHSTTSGTSQVALVVFLKLLSKYCFHSKQPFLLRSWGPSHFTACCLEEEEGEEAAATLVRWRQARLLWVDGCSQVVSTLLSSVPPTFLRLLGPGSQ